MSFVLFVIFCVVALIVYYVVIILRPDKKGFSLDDSAEEFTNEIVIDPPIAVTMGMVTFIPTVSTTNSERENSNINSDGSQSPLPNRYEQSTASSNSSLAEAEIASYLTKEAINEGKSLFSNIFL